MALASRGDGKVQLLVALTPSLLKERWDAREIFRSGQELVKARGGGRSTMGEGCGSAPEAAEQALEAMEDRVRRGT